MAGLPQQRLAAITEYPGLQVARRFDVVDHHRTRVTPEKIGGEEHELPVGINDLAILGYDTESIAITVESETQLVVRCLQAANQVLQVFRLRRIRMMVGKRAVHVAEKLGHRAAESRK